jgi:hypothetical protein
MLTAIMRGSEVFTNARDGPLLMNTWWQRNAENGFTSIMLGYSLGKAQRIMKYLDRNIGEVICHSAIADANRALEFSGFTFGSWTEAGKAVVDFSTDSLSRSLLICPPNALNIILPESWTRGLVKKSLNLTKRYDQTNPTQIHA